MMLILLRTAIVGVALLLWWQGAAKAGDIALVLTSFFVLQGYLRDIGQHVRNLQRSVNDMEEMVALDDQDLGIDEVWLLQADTQLSTEPVRVRSADIVGEITVHGRGGTQFDAALRALEELQPKPDIAIYMTDGDGDATYEPVGVEVIFLVVRSYWNRTPAANFGHTIIVSDKPVTPRRPRR